MKIFTSIDEMVAASGQDIGVSDWQVIDQARVNTFADATGDHQWIHIDVERARRELPAKGTIAHGFLTLSLVPWLADMVFRCEGVSRALNYGLNRVRFMNMVPTGSRVRLRCKLLGAEKRAGGIQFVFEHTIEIEGQDRPACVAEMLSVLYP